MSVTKVVITGAPCSGKTTIINKLLSHYSTKGVPIFVCKESATAVLDKGFDRKDVPAFEEEIAKTQILAEEEIMKKAEATGNKNVLVLFDRGLADCFSYVSDKKSFSRKVGFDYCSTWGRYDAVIMLETTAKYGYIANNDVRIESVEEAKKHEQYLLDVYVGHPHLRYIGYSENIEEKFEKVVKQIDTLLNNFEIEKKYLVEYPDFEALSKYKPFKSAISQTYLLCKNGSHRVRRREFGGNIIYFENMKKRITEMRTLEYENVISEQDYNELLSEADPAKRPIIKDRYCFLYEGQYFELDVFEFWNDKAFVELELTDENDAVKLPPEINVIKDVSDDPKYKNNYLARTML